MDLSFFLRATPRVSLGSVDGTPTAIQSGKNPVCMPQGGASRRSCSSTTMDPEAIADAILVYLVRHPESQDTVKGVAEWWLRGITPQPGVPETEEALERLKEQGWVLTRNAADGRTHYRFNTAKGRSPRSNPGTEPGGTARPKSAPGARDRKTNGA